MSCEAGEELTVTVVGQRQFDSIPSGSGITKHKEHLYVISDDAPSFYRLSLQDYSYSSYPIKGFGQDSYRIPKPVKPDFETAFIGKFCDREYVFSFGSGSISPQRDSLLMFNPEEPTDQQLVPLSSLYEAMRLQTRTAPEHWNVEGAVLADDTLILMNRGNNMVIKLPWKEFVHYISTGAIPVVYGRVLHLPSYGSYLARLSGACKFKEDGDILFCASIEDTPSWYTDGPVIGSFIGIFNYTDGEVKRIGILKTASGQIMQEKLESVEVINPLGRIQFVAVADNDQGSTKLFILEINEQ